MIRRFALPRPSLRVRLTAWYLLTLTLILFLSGLTLYWQTQRSLRSQIDAALQLAAAQAAVNVDRDNGRLAFQNAENFDTRAGRFSDDTMIFLLSPAGDVWGKFGYDSSLPPFPAVPGLQTARYGDDDWRVYVEPITDAEQTITGRLQVAQSLEPMAELLAALQIQLLWGLPLALALAGAGGYFLASRALAPIERITRTGQAITASDLSRRIDYVGPADEVGRLAATFDRMLDRLQIGFERERRFTGDAAHELRTPLAALKGRIGVTLSQPRRPEEYVDTLQDMEHEVDRLARLSGDLLYMARLEQGQFTPDQEPVALDDLLGAVVDQLQPQADGKNIAIALSVAPGLAIHGNLDMLIRLFLNLLDNAVKYTPPGGRVVVAAGQEKAAVVVRVRDNGPGIAEKHLPHLFERFYRADGARMRGAGDSAHRGAGLGLAIAYEIVNAHGGELTVQSSPHQGTTFTARFPQAPA